MTKPWKFDFKGVFDRVRKFAKDQGKKSLDDDHEWDGEECRYRNKDGLKCFVGCLIPDDRYDPSTEGKDVCNRTVLDQIPEFDGIILPSDDPTYRSLMTENVRRAIEFLGDLQAIHDGFEPDEWEDEFEEMAKQYGFGLSD